MQINFQTYFIKPQPENTTFGNKKSQVLKNLENKTSKKLKEISNSKLKKIERDQIIIKMLEEGFTKIQIAQILNITVQTILNVIKRLDFVSPITLRNKRIIERLKNNETLEQISQEENVSLAVISSLAKKAGIKTVTNFQKNKQKRDSLISYMLRIGFKAKDISEALDINIGIIQNISKSELKPTKQFKEERFLRIVEKIKQNIPFEQIAKEENLKPCTIKYMEKKALKMGLLDSLRISQQHTESEKKIKKVLTRARRGETVEEIINKENILKRHLLYIAHKTNTKLITNFQKQIQERNQAILNDLLSGMNRKQIAQKYKIGIGIINGIAEKNKTYRTVLSEQAKRINKMLESGLSIKEIAEIENINPSTVFRNASKENLAKLRNKFKERDAKIMQDFFDGVPVEQIAKKYNLSIGRILNIKSRELKLKNKKDS